MNDSTLKRTSSLSSIPSAPRRPQKLGSVQSIVKDESDQNAPSPFEEITLSDDDDETVAKPVKCPTCSRDMSIWTVSRRDIHTKVCRQRKEEKEKEKQTIKRRSNTLTETIEKHDKVLEKAGFLEPQKSWELSKNNVKFARIAADDEENRKRKRPRSFAVVELAPKKCQCEVLTTLHSRFIDEFHCKSLKNTNEGERGTTEHAFQMRRMIGKLSRYEQLSIDMQKTLDDLTELIPSIITFKSSEGYHVKSQSLILKHRTTLIRTHPKIETIIIEQPRDVLKAWLTFVFTANIEWNDSETEGVRELAIMYGPIGLENLLHEEKREKEKTQNLEERVSTSVQGETVSADDVVEVLETLQDSKMEEPVEPDDPIESPVNYFTSDDPLIGFGKTVENGKEDEDQPIFIDSPSGSSFKSPISQKSRNNITMDSFDEWSNQQSSSFPSTSSPVNWPPPLSSPAKPTPTKSSPIKTVTPIRNVAKPVFGSHIKILKTNDVTPMPLFDMMDEAELKERMKEIGMRPKGKKAMIQILKKAYTTLHPEICTGTPTIRPLIRTESNENVTEGKVGKPGKGATKTKTLSERMAASPKKPVFKNITPKKLSDSVDEDDVDADKTLNISNDERETGKICGDDIGEDEDEDEDDEVGACSSKGKSDLDALKNSFLAWIRHKDNSVLHEHILSLQPVSLEEMLIRLEKAEGPLGRIGKGKLVKVLEMLRITYQLPQQTGRRGGFKRRL